MPATPDTTESPFALVFDTTVLSNFALIGEAQLLEGIYAGRACTTLMVVEEIHKGIEAGYRELEAIEQGLAPLQPSGWLSVVAPESAEEHALYVSLLSSLGPGEASCLAVARVRGMTLATDDRAARRKATEQGVAVTGTLGILIRLVRDGRLSLADANGLLAQMITRGYRSLVKELDNLV